MTVCSLSCTCTSQSESTLYSCLNVKDFIAQSRNKICNLSDCNWTRTQNHLVRNGTLNHLAKWLSVCLQTKWLWVRDKLQLLKTIMQPFLLYLKINSLPNKVVQTRSLVHYVLLRHPFFSTTIWNQNPSQSSLSSCIIYFLRNSSYPAISFSYYNARQYVI